VLLRVGIKMVPLIKILKYKVRLNMKNKWSWKMDYCWVNKIPPAQKWAWDITEKAYNHSNVESDFIEYLDDIIKKP